MAGTVEEVSDEQIRQQFETNLFGLLNVTRAALLLLREQNSMWRPLEIFLYDWWPIRDEARLSDRLAAMPVRIRYLNAKEPDAWRGDWPAVSPSGERASSEVQPRALNQAS